MLRRESRLEECQADQCFLPGTVVAVVASAAEAMAHLRVLPSGLSRLATSKRCFRQQYEENGHEAIKRDGSFRFLLYEWALNASADYASPPDAIPTPWKVPLRPIHFRPSGH